LRISTGIAGLDHILQGGLLPARTYLVYGEPGTGKTTLGLHFLSCDPCSSLLISFSQTAERIRSDAASLNLDIANLTILDFTPAAETFSEIGIYDIFSPAEVEREPLSRQISTAIQEKNPKRIFVDSFGSFRSLATDAFQHRRLAQSFFRFATMRGGTLLIASEEKDYARDVDGVIHLASGAEGRSVRVTKLRGSDFHAGTFSMRLSSEGLDVSLSVA
jgi:circadian clock protein KaiC